jgi:uncharacterized protein YbcI
MAASKERIATALQAALDDNNMEAASELRAMYLSSTGPEESQPTLSAPETYTPTNMAPEARMREFLGTVTPEFQKLREVGQRNLQEFGQGVSDEGATLARVGVEGVLPAAATVAGAVFKLGSRALGDLTPDVLENAVGQKVLTAYSEATNFLENSEEAQSALALAKQGFAAYSKWKQGNPEVARDVENLFDVATLMSPATKVSPILPVDVMDTAARKLTIAAKTQSREARKDTVLSMLDPDPLESGRGKVTTEGILGKKTYNPTAGDLEVAEVITNIKAFNPKESFTNNARRIEETIESTRTELDNRILSKGNPKINVKLVGSKIRKDLIDLMNSPEFAVSGAVPKQAKAFNDVALDLIAKSDGTTLGLLNVRRSLDKWAKDNSPAAFSPDYENSKRKIYSELRRSINEEVAATVPDVNVMGLLKKQTQMYNGLDIIDFKAKKESLTVLGRHLGNLERTYGIKPPSTPLAQAATIGAGVSVAASVPGTVILGAGATVLTGALALKYFRGPKAKENIAFLMKQTTKGIKKSENTAMISQLKADRLILIDYLNDIRTQPLPTSENTEEPLLSELFPEE